MPRTAGACGAIALLLTLVAISAPAFDINECDGGDPPFGDRGITLGWKQPTSDQLQPLYIDMRGAPRSGLSTTEVRDVWLSASNAWVAVGQHQFRFPVSPTEELVSGLRLGESFAEGAEDSIVFTVIQTDTTIPAGAGTFTSGATGWSEITGLDSSVLGVTAVMFRTNDRQFFDADVLINDDTAPADFSLMPSPSSYHLPTVIRHELGHLIGIGHAQSSSSLMYATLGLDMERTIVADDAWAIRFLYPAAGVTTPNPDRNDLSFVSCTERGFSGPIESSLQPDPDSGGCRVSPGGAEGSPWPLGLIALIAGLSLMRLAGALSRRIATPR